MSRNLCSSYCVKCGHGPVRLEDLRGKPIEFRRYYSYAPVLGCRWDCPQCETAYFAVWRADDAYWSVESLRNGEWKAPIFYLPDGTSYPNSHAGKFAVERTFTFGGVTETNASNTGCFSIDLSYYETYNDEPLYTEKEAEQAIRRGEQPPSHLCDDNAEDAQWVWGSPRTSEE